MDEVAAAAVDERDLITSIILPERIFVNQSTSEYICIYKEEPSLGTNT